VPKPININPREAQKRRLFGIAMAAVAIAAAVGLILSGDISRWWRCVVFLPAWASALGFLQAYHST
jgi:hypothetical protein